MTVVAGGGPYAIARYPSQLQHATPSERCAAQHRIAALAGSGGSGEL